MEQELDLAAAVAGLLFLGILIGSVTLWIRQGRGSPAPDVGVPAWPIGWSNFGLFLCTIIIAVVVVQNIGIALLPEGAATAESELTPELAIIAILLLQLPMLAVFYGLRAAVPEAYGGPLNRRVLGFGSALRQALPLFIQFLPVIWLAGMLWNVLLNVFETVGLIQEAPPQELVMLFAGGGHPLLIGILVLFAVGLAPLVEEIIFRGCIYRFLKSKTSLTGAQVVSGMLFAMLHGNMLSFGPLLVVGIVLAQVYEKSGNILVAIGFHALFNSLTLFMLLLANQSSVLPN